MLSSNTCWSSHRYDSRDIWVNLIIIVYVYSLKTPSILSLLDNYTYNKSSHSDTDSNYSFSDVYMTFIL